MKNLTLFWQGFAQVPYLKADVHSRPTPLQGRPFLLSPFRYLEKVRGKKSAGNLVISLSVADFVC